MTLYNKFKYIYFFYYCVLVSLLVLSILLLLYFLLYIDNSKIIINDFNSYDLHDWYMFLLVVFLFYTILVIFN